MAERKAMIDSTHALSISRPTLYQLLARCGLKKIKSDDQKEKA
jgi:hypothetical protein